MIYTKRGDRGKTYLFRGARVLKSSKKIEAIGAIDELNSYLGIVRSINSFAHLDRKLKLIQSDLFLIGAIIAGYNSSFDRKRVSRIEREIDNIESSLPTQTSFIFFSGDKIATNLFYARSLARNAERRLVSIRGKIDPLIIAYFNRLSDYLFILGRWVNFKSGVEEEIWKPS